MPKGERGTAKPYLRGKIWWVKYYVDGKPEYESSKSESKTDALKLLNKRRAEIDEGRVSPADATVGNLLTIYEADLRRNNKAWLRSVSGYIKHHLRPALGKKRAGKITTKDIETYIDARRKEGHADATINRELSCLSRAFTLAMEATPPLVTRKPKIKKLAEDNVREGFLEHPDYLRLREELPWHQQLVLVIGYHLGLRRGEILKLKWTQIDWEHNLLYLSRRQTKGKKARIAPLYGELRKWMEKAYARRDCEFIVSWEGHSITQLKRAWKNACGRVGLDGTLVHDLRRTAVRNMVRAGIPEKQAMLISGHKTRSVFDRYNIIDERDAHTAGEKLTAYLAKQPKKRREVVTLEVTTKKATRKRPKSQVA